LRRNLITKVFSNKEQEDIENTREAHKAVLEELIEMNGWCSTGHLNRLLNTLQGFDPLLQLSLPIKDEIKSSVFSRLNNYIKHCSPELKEELALAFTNTEKSILYEFIETYSPYEELKVEYKHIDQELFEKYYQEAITLFIG
jgi:hypothetical protein